VLSDAIRTSEPGGLFWAMTPAPWQIKLLKPEAKCGILGKVKTPRVTEEPFQIKATASTPLYLLGKILPEARRLVKWAAF
jgi:hypothetical protein